jgi:hypothetical protein
MNKAKRDELLVKLSEAQTHTKAAIIELETYKQQTPRPKQRISDNKQRKEIADGK